MNTWEDTVMTLEEYNQFTKDWYGKRGIPGTWMQADALGTEYKATLEHQAEITYHSRDSEVAEARKAGIKLATKWIKGNAIFSHEPSFEHIKINRAEFDSLENGEIPKEREHIVFKED